MAVTITAALVSATDPKPVQIVLNGITAALTYSVTGSALGSSWPVPGGQGVSTGVQIVLVDNRAALNTPVTYSVVVSGVTYAATPVTVTSASEFILQSLDGQIVVAPFALLAGDFPISPALRSVSFDVPGRARPPIRFAPAGDGGGAFDVYTDPPATETMRTLLATGGPIVYRSSLPIRDLPAVDLLLPTSVTSAGDVSGGRIWNLQYLLVGDPQPSQALSAFTWDYWDAKFAAKTWTDFDTIFAGGDWDDFDAYDFSLL